MSCLMGHDGPGHIAIAQGKTKVRPLQVYHGKLAGAFFVESREAWPGYVALGGASRKGSAALLAAKVSPCPGAILEIGNTNSLTVFDRRPEFHERLESHGPAHHCPVGVGHISGKLNKLERCWEWSASRFVRVLNGGPQQLSFLDPGSRLFRDSALRILFLAFCFAKHTLIKAGPG